MPAEMGRALGVDGGRKNGKENEYIESKVGGKEIDHG